MSNRSFEIDTTGLGPWLTLNRSLTKGKREKEEVKDDSSLNLPALNLPPILVGERPMSIEEELLFAGLTS